MTAMMHRRRILGAAGAAATGLLGGLALPRLATAADDYRALVVIALNGGNDGNNCLVPTDGAYTDYQSSRANLALPKSSLLALNGTAAGHSFGVHPALAEMQALYNQRRLAFISNVGPLIEPATGAQVLANSVKLPPFLMSHSDQTAIAQGWTVTEDMSGWAGRGLEALPANLRNVVAAVTSDTNRTLVLGKQSPVAFLPPGGTRWWGAADLAYPETPAAQSINRMARWQFANDYEAEYARTMGQAVADSTFFTKAFLAAGTPAGNFSDAPLGNNLRSLASVLPVFRSLGLKRQVFLVSWGGFDTHANQRGSDANTQDAQLAELSKALAAFDQSNQASGVDSNVVTLVMTEFGRTLRPGSGGGSEHAWGNHWFAFGGPVAGGNVVGSFPSMVLGGADDGDPNKNGRHVPSISSDQVGATLMSWLGVPDSQFGAVFPYLNNFQNKTIPLLRA